MKESEPRRSFVEVARPIIRGTIFVGSIVAASVLPFFAFGGKAKQQIREDYQGRCAICGSRYACECHHIIKQEWHGKDTAANGVLLCSNKGKDHHEVYDKLADKGIVYPGIPIEEADPSLWRSAKDRERTLKRFGR